MSESLAGLLVIATRQNGCSDAIVLASAGATPRPGAVGGVNAPAATSVADVTVAFGKRNEDNPSHGVRAAATRTSPGARRARRTATPRCQRRMVSPQDDKAETTASAPHSCLTIGSTTSTFPVVQKRSVPAAPAGFS